MAHYSENEIAFFNQLVHEYDIRIDGREKMEFRNYLLTNDIITTCFSSLKISYNNSKNEIIFAVKGEVTPLSQINETNKVINLSIDSMQKGNENPKIKSQIENLLNNMLIDRTKTDQLIIPDSKPEMVWKIYVDIFIFDEIKLSIFQMLELGVRKVLSNIKVPKIITFFNEITNNYEYDLKTNYGEIAEADSEYYPRLTPPEILVFSVMNNKLYLDPTNEEWDISDCIIFISVLNKKILQVQSIGESVNPLIILELENVVSNINGDN